MPAYDQAPETSSRRLLSYLLASSPLPTSHRPVGSRRSDCSAQSCVPDSSTRPSEVSLNAVRTRRWASCEPIGRGFRWPQRRCPRTGRESLHDRQISLVAPRCPHHPPAPLRSRSSRHPVASAARCGLHAEAGFTPRRALATSAAGSSSPSAVASSRQGSRVLEASRSAPSPSAPLVVERLAASLAPAVAANATPPPADSEEVAATQVAVGRCQPCRVQPPP